MAAADSTNLASSPLRIFVVDDHRDTREAIRLYLEMLGHTVLCAGSMTEALQALPQADCDVLIADLALRDGDGLELLRRVRSRLHHPVSAIAISGYGLAGDKLLCKEAGYLHHLLKPIKPGQLDVALREIVQDRGSAG